MKIPKYWSRATAENTDRDGRKVAIACWRWSDAGRDEAHQSALAAAQRALARLLRGERLDRYSYGRMPLREEVLQTVEDARGKPFLAVSRNRYGAIILNTARVAFLDLDFPAANVGVQLKRLFARLLGRSVASADAQREAEIWSRLEQFVAGNPDYGFRVYRTCAGVRAMATHALFDPASPATLGMLRQLGSDPLYVRLCQVQECFRARLTPKPWRCGCPSNPASWPRDGADQQSRFEAWEAGYTAAQEGYATCRWLGTLGVEHVLPEAQQIIRLHDQMTRCHDKLKLA